MEKDYLFLAIKNLKPTAEFSYSDQDYATIQWDVLDGDAPTLSQINAEITKIKKAEVTAEADKAAAKAALLERLGITEEETALLLG